MSVNGNAYRPLSRSEAIETALEAEAQLFGMDLPVGLSGSLLNSVQISIAQRSRADMEIDCSGKEDVTGLVRAAMGGYDHLTPARRALCKYVAGVVQSGQDVESILLAQAQEGLADSNDATEI